MRVRMEALQSSSLYQKRSHHLLLRVGGRDSLHDCGNSERFVRGELGGVFNDMLRVS